MLKTLLALCLFLEFSVAHAGGSNLALEMLAANTKERAFSEEIQMMNEFAINKAADCKTWNAKSFEVQKDLRESCQFPVLFNQYKRKLTDLRNPEMSGLDLPPVSIANAEIPMLQSGAWQRFIFSESDGASTALEVITLRMAIEKSLIAHANLVRQQGPQNTFKPFAALVVPRMIGSFSGYSQTLRSLVFINNFKCGANKTPACLDSQKELEQMRGQILFGIGNENFFAGFANMTAENSDRDNLKVKNIQKVVQLVSKVKSQLSLQELMDSMHGKQVHPLFLELSNEFASTRTLVLRSASEDIVNMLVSVSILSEIYEIQNLKEEMGAVAPSQAPDSLAQKTAEEMNTLKSYVLTVLNYQEPM